MMWAWSTVASAIAALPLVFGSCSVSQRTAVLSEKEATLLAVQIANDEAMRLYQIKPFDTNRCEMECATNCWNWQALVGYGRSDMRGKVSFDLDGSNPMVHVEMLTSYPEEPFSAPRFKPEPRIQPPPEQFKPPPP